MFQHRFWIAVTIFPLIAVAVSCGPSGGKPPVTSPAQHPLEGLRPISELLSDWKPANRITIDVTDAPLKEVMQELTRQSGVHFESFHKDKKLSLKLKDVPFWQAVAEASIQVDLPIWVYGNKEIHFSEIADYVFHRYQVVGPFHIGVTSETLTLKDNKNVSALVIRASSLARDAHLRMPGIDEASLESPTEKPVTLKMVLVQGKADSAFFVVPEEMVKKKVRLRARFDCEVYLNPQEIVVPAVAGNTAEFNHFGGIKVSIGPSDKNAVAYAVKWDAKVRGDDAKKLDAMNERFRSLFQGKGNPMSAEEQTDWQKWMDAKAADIRMLEVVEKQLLDKEEQPVKWAGTSHITLGNSIEGEVCYDQGAVPAKLRLMLADKKIVKGIIEFDDVFSVGTPHPGTK